MTEVPFWITATILLSIMAAGIVAIPVTFVVALF